ncbi:MAG TPA: hypothetical protein VNR11_05520 [Xanthobacteraceae bacterium]|nr:hypothetical protein [Xanthobacteraceae bacterium]
MSDMWIKVSESERALVLGALFAIARGKSGLGSRVAALVHRLTVGPQHPDITIGVHGGQVQWTLGHTFPIRICDYDGDVEDLPDVDEHGQPCRIWFEPCEIGEPDQRPTGRKR